MDNFELAKNHFLEGVNHLENGRPQEAEHAFIASLTLLPDRASTLINLSATQIKLKKFTDAEISLLKVISLDANNSEAFLNLGLIEKEKGALEKAIHHFNQAIQLNDDYVEAYLNKGAALNDMKCYAEALTSYEKAIHLSPNYAELWSNRGVTLHELKRYEEALSSYEKASALNPRFQEAWLHKGVTLNAIQKYDEAIQAYGEAIQLRSDYAEAWSNKGVTLNELKRYSNALACYDKATTLKQDCIEAWINKGAVLNELKRPGAALHSYQQAFQLNPGMDYLLGNLIYTKLLTANWAHLDEEISLLTEKIYLGKKSTPPFNLLAMIDSPALQLCAAKIWGEDKHPTNISLGPVQKKKHEKIRLGYYSADFHNHATSYLMAEFFELHDKNHFELIAFSFGPSIQDESRQRLINTFDQFLEVTEISDKRIAKLSREMEIDIAIDLKGYTQNCRPGIFAYRAAPIQVNYLGYPSTMGVDYMDYIIADPVLILPEHQQFYSEKVVYLPNSYQVNDTKRKISDRVFSKAELGLPEAGFVFCCFNNNYKITPTTLDSWARILNQVEGSVLWLLEDNTTAKKNLIKEATTRGIAKERLVFAGRLDLPDHLARHHLADLFLDTLPCNAHTTASDALWAGLPLLTFSGESFASRVAASLLNAVDLPELIVHSQEQYESSAIELATNQDQLKKIKNHLKADRPRKALFDIKNLTQHIEMAYIQMYERYRDDLAPDYIYIGKKSLR